MRLTREQTACAAVATIAFALGYVTANRTYTLPKDTEILLHKGPDSRYVLEIQKPSAPDDIFIGYVFADSQNPRSVFTSADAYLDPLMPITRKQEEEDIHRIMYPPKPWEE